MSLALDPDVSFVSDADRDLFTYVAIALMSHRRARPGDDIQDKTDLRGWWGDAFPDVEGDEFGSRLWTLEGRGMPYALENVGGIVEEALQCGIDDGLYIKVETAARIVGPGVMLLEVTVTLPSGEISDVLGPWYISV